MTTPTGAGGSDSIAVIDYGMGNLHSVASALAHVAPRARVRITAERDEIAAADRIIFPGVGAIRDCMGEIRRLGFDTAVGDAVAAGKPILAICVGLQALMQHSEENGGVDCLGILPGRVRFFGRDLRAADGRHLKVPHMGWNQVEQTLDHPLWHGIAQHSRFYFVHSYYVEAGDASQVAGRCHYHCDFAAALARDNLFAVQFHPEKSHTAGLQLLQNFTTWQGQC
ncbi:imidazole glycerol phosphate synthase subunit HisH [Exilibacterium tricleocarpae]|uniref:Imidazole glycerol phosphate synthase subunit HisH n=1 Tax=Exilibacterium tricleocarpae TaxID=2591008 RepID=A0A545SLX9_9GAMM|nr:imidazole glycerol phosphate synthase subunit HisH [Exilibacterium tricleocarpae]TQV65985.1 imidazole glycerol phosphate synthase subunit HisH [Exilibacterium tricleocarpae]